MSPKFKITNGYVFKIYSNEEKRMHIHVVKAEHEAKFWLEPEVELAENYGFPEKEIRKLTLMVQENADDFKTKYQQHTGKCLDD